MNITPEWINIAITAIVGLVGVFNLVQTLKVKLALEQQKVWTHENFVSKESFLETVGLFHETGQRRQGR